jgi:type IV secretion system protein VirB6
MGFFATFWAWLNGQLANYIGSNTALVAAALEPAIVTLATIYVMVWGYLQLTGSIGEPFTAGLKRVLTLAAVLGIATQLWLYNSLIVDTFYSAPARLAAAIIGVSDPVDTLDLIWSRGGAVAGYLWNNGGVFSGDFGYYVAGAVVWVLVGLLCAYTIFLVALSSVALAVLLALGPMFIAFLLFENTQRFFQAWVAQLANYALISVLTVLMAALLLQIVESYAMQTAARGAAIVTVDALDMVLVAVLVFLLMRQVMPIAAALAGGVGLSTFSLASRFIGWGMRQSSAAGRGALGLSVAALGAPRTPPAPPATLERSHWGTP